MDAYTRTKTEFLKALAVAFPGQEFNVKTSRGIHTHQGGSHINALVSWVDGPTLEDVSIAIDKHFYHHYNDWGSMWCTSRELSSQALAGLLAEYHVTHNWDGRIANVQRGRVEFHNADNECAFWRMASQRSFFGRKLAATDLAGDYEAMLAYRDF